MMTADWRGSFVPALTQIKATGRRFGSNRPMTESRLAPDAPRLEVSPLSKAEAPAAFAFPGDKGFGATKPEYDCDMMMTRLDRRDNA